MQPKRICKVLAKMMGWHLRKVEEGGSVYPEYWECMETWQPDKDTAQAVMCAEEFCNNNGFALDVNYYNKVWEASVSRDNSIDSCCMLVCEHKSHARAIAEAIACLIWK